MQEHSAILSTFIKLPFSIKTFVFFLFISGRFRQVLLYNAMLRAGIHNRHDSLCPLTLGLLGNCRLLIFFQNKLFAKNSFVITIRGSNSLKPDQP